MDSHLENTTTPLLSIIMAAYNVEKYIASSIASILNQDYYNFELLIYNDASTDNTLNIIKEINDPRIKIFNNYVNVGVSEARNILLSKAKGEFISIFDSDDISCQKKFSYCIKYLINNPIVDLIGTRIFFVNQNSKKINFIRTFESLKHEDIIADLLFNNTFATSTIIFKKKILPLVKFPKSIHIGEDYYLWSKLSQKVICENLDKKLTKYRINPNSLSHKMKDDLKVTLNLIHDELLASLGLKATKKVLSVHNKHLYSDDLSLKFLLDSIIHYNSILSCNKIYNKKSLLKAIRKNWFMKCLFSSKIIGIKALKIYLFNFPYHDLTVFKNTLYLIGYYFIYNKKGNK